MYSRVRHSIRRGNRQAGPVLLPPALVLALVAMFDGLTAYALPGQERSGPRVIAKEHHVFVLNQTHIAGGPRREVLRVQGASHPEAVAAHGPVETATMAIQAVRKAVYSRPLAVKTLVLKGSVRLADMNDAGTLQPPMPFEIRILLPNSYLEISHVAPNILYKRGSHDGTAVNRFVTSGAGMSAKGSATDRDLDEAQLMLASAALGILVETRTAVPLAPLSVENCGTDCTAIKMAGRQGAIVQLEVDRRTSLPLRVRYQGEVSFPRPRPAGVRGRPLPAPAPPAEPAEIVLSFEDRRAVDGLSLPFSVQKTSRGVVLREFRIEAASVNPPLSAKDFE